MKKTPNIIDTYYKSLGTKIFRDTTALPFADGGPLNDRNIHGDLLPSVYASALGRYYGNGGKFLTAGGEYHRIYKNPEGDIMVNHPQEDKGKWDTINLTEKADANTITEGVKATKQWHADNPNVYGSGGQMKPDYSLPEDSFQQGGRGLKNSVYASSMGQYPAPYAEGGPLNGDPGPKPKFKPQPKPLVITDPKEYAYRKAAYDDSLWLYQNNLRTPALMQPYKSKYKKNDSWLEKLAKWSVDEKVINRKNLTLTPQQFNQGLKTTWYQSGIGRLIDPVGDGKSQNLNKLYTTNEADKHTYSPVYDAYYGIGKSKNQKTGYYLTDYRDLPNNEPINYLGNIMRSKNNTGESGQSISHFEPRYKKPVQPVVFQELSKPIKKSYPPIIKKPVTYINPPVEEIIPTEQPQPPIQDNYPPPPVEGFPPGPPPPPPFNGVEPFIQGDPIPEYATPDPGAEFVPDTERYIDWNGNSIGFNGVRFRKPGHGGDLIKKGSRHYLHYPSIETRHSADIVPEDTEEFAQGGTMNQYPDGGPIYTYAKRPGSYYQKDENGQWLISNKGTGGQYVPVDDPSGQRAAALNKGAVVYNQPVQEGVKPAPLQFTGNINQPVEPAYNPLYTNPNAQYSETTQQVASKMVPQTKQGRQDLEFVKQNNANRKADVETFLTTQGNTPEEAAQIVGSYGSNWTDLESKYANDIQNMNQTAATISQGGNPYSMQEFVPREAQSIGGKVEDMMFNPFTTAGYALRGQAIPDYMGEKIDNGTLGYYANGQFVQGRNMLDNVTDIATPIGWAHSGKNIAERATNDKSGDFWTEENAWDALNVLPGLGFAKAAKVARGVEAANSTTGLARLGNNVVDLAERAQLTRTKPQIIESAIDAGSIAREPFYAPQRPSLLNPSNSKFYKTEGQIGENTSTGLTNADIQREVDKNLAWINSDEYALRRSANTNESLKQVKKSVDKTIREARNARFDVNSNMLSVDKDVQGVVTPRSLETLFRAPKVEIANYAFNPKGTLAHEVKHLYSPATYRGQSGDGTLHRNWWNPDVATLPANKRGLYANYPSLGGLQLDDAENAYLAAGYEQQVRHLNAREKILGENKLPLDAKLDEDQVRNFVDNWADRMNQRRKSPNDKTIPIEDFDDIWGLEAEKIQKEMLMSKYNTDDLNYLNDLPTNQRLKFMDFYKDRLSKNVTDVLNKAWMTVPALGAGALLNSTDNNKKTQ